MNKRRAFTEIKDNPKNVRFNKMCNIAEAFGFRFRGGKGSHRIYVREDITELLNFQNANGKAKTLSGETIYKNCWEI